MSTLARLTLYGAGLVAVFAVLFIAGRALVPDSTVADWTKEAKGSGGHDSMEESEAGGEHESMDSAPAGGSLRGLSVEQDGYRLNSVRSPAEQGRKGDLSFQVLGPDGKPFMGFAESHEKELHLITVRSDGAQFRHVHPELDRATGTWSIPWDWPTGGTYRVFADFVPAGGEDAPNVTLTRNVDVAGEFSPVKAPLSDRDEVDGYEVTINGDLAAGETRELVVEVSRDGKPVTDLQPYLGAFGHLVALREGDLAYLHVHAEGEEPAPGDTAGPDIGFATEAPTPGRYLMYLDFKVDSRVHTAEFILEAK
jgi:hypothetical protein